MPATTILRGGYDITIYATPLAQTASRRFDVAVMLRRYATLC